MKRITSLALSAALLASLSTPVLAAPAISVDAAPTAAVLEEENSLWELPQADTPDMSNTVWSFAGGYIDGSEMTQAEMDESLAAYGGTLAEMFPSRLFGKPFTLTEWDFCNPSEYVCEGALLTGAYAGW